MDNQDENDKKVSGRRDFLKSALITASSVVGFLSVLRFDSSDGVKIAGTKVSLGMSEANAACSFSSTCSGGGGQCSFGSSCGGGGGACSFGSSCSGGGGQCSFGSNCGGS